MCQGNFSIKKEGKKKGRIKGNLWECSYSHQTTLADGHTTTPAFAFFGFEAFWWFWSICGALTAEAKHRHRRDSGTEPEVTLISELKCQAGRLRAREQHQGREEKSACEGGEQNNRDERNHLPHLSAQHTLPWAQSSSGTVKLKMIPGIAALREVLKCKLLGGSSVDFPEVWKMHLSALQAISHDKCTHLLLPFPSKLETQHHTGLWHWAFQGLGFAVKIKQWDQRHISNTFTLPVFKSLS